MTTTSPLTEDEIKALREVAERARRVTAPEWSANLYKYPLGDTGDYDHCAVVLAQFGDIMTPRPFANVEDLGHDADAQKYLTEYIAKFDPQTVLSLLDEIERLRNGVKKVKAAQRQWQAIADQLAGNVSYVRELTLLKEILEALDGSE